MTILNDSFLEDLGSTNGTLVNGQPVKKHFLQSSDTVEIGKYKLKYMNEAPATMSQADFEKTMVLRAPAAAAPKQEVRNPTDTQTNPAGNACRRRGGLRQGPLRLLRPWPPPRHPRSLQPLRRRPSRPHLPPRRQRRSRWAPFRSFPARTRARNCRSRSP